jgi:hypothetical protein
MDVIKLTETENSLSYLKKKIIIVEDIFENIPFWIKKNLLISVY